MDYLDTYAEQTEHAGLWDRIALSVRSYTGQMHQRENSFKGDRFNEQSRSSPLLVSNSDIFWTPQPPIELKTNYSNSSNDFDPFPRADSPIFPSEKSSLR